MVTKHMNSVQMNDEQPPAVTRKLQFDWRKDLEASRDLMRRDMDAYGYVLSWIENWRVQRDLPPGRETMEAWWRECAKKKEQPAWRLRQWKDAIVWYLNWLELCRKSGGTGRSIPNCLKEALVAQIAKARVFWEADRANDVPGVQLPGALARKFSKSGTKWAWMWIFPADHLS